MFFKIMKYDIKNGLVKEYKKYLLFVVFFISAGIIFRLSVLNESVVTFGNYNLFVHSGMEEYIPDFSNRFQFPIIWVCFHMLAYFSVLYYPYNDIDGFGKSVLIQSMNRSAWYFSKCCWVIISIAIYFALFMLSQAILCLFFGDSITLLITQDYAFYSIPVTVESFTEYPTDISVLLYALPFAVCVALGLMQTALSLIIKPFYSYIASAAILIGSAYYLSPVMLGNYAMVQRSSIFLANGVDARIGLVFCFLLSVASIICGIFIFNKYDILNRG